LIDAFEGNRNLDDFVGGDGILANVLDTQFVWCRLVLCEMCSIVYKAVFVGMR
jgi:hypothetical protein